MRGQAPRYIPPLDPHAVARALRGEASASTVTAPGPGHSPCDRSLSIKVVHTAPDGFLVHSFAGDSYIECRNYVRSALGICGGERLSLQPRRRKLVARHEYEGRRSALALRAWHEALSPMDTLVVAYLLSRSLTIPNEVAGDVIRFHPALMYEGACVGGMVALFRDIVTDEPCGIHRTFLDGDGRKLGRKMWGRARGAAIKLDADACVTIGVHVGEGVETCLAARLAGFRPVWALGSVGAIRDFPLLPGIEAVTILGEVGDSGANYRAAEVCASRWIAAGRQAFIVAPQIGGDLNDVWREVVS